MSKQAILIDLDSLLDTRIATVSKINQNAAIKLLGNRRYYDRQLNDFGELCGVPKRVFDSWFARRDNATLRSSLPTAIILALRVMMADLATQSHTTPFVEGARLVINSYPYTLNEAECKALTEVIEVYSGMKDRVDIVRLSWADLTPLYIKEHFTGLILYNFSEWMEEQQERFLKTRLTDVVVLAPALYRDRIPQGDEGIVPGAEGYTPFDITEGALVGCFDLHFLSMVYFSLIPPDELGKTIQPPPPIRPTAPK